MSNMHRHLFRLALAILIAAAPVAALAQEPPAPASPEATKGAAPVPTMERYGVENPQCAEWSNSCQICRRDEKGVVHCSTPGIACQPQAIVCVPRKPDAAPAPPVTDPPATAPPAPAAPPVETPPSGLSPK
ncbi:MAG: hypothetical protein AB7F96_05935 [Beijerinckiaceae bacterium]